MAQFKTLQFPNTSNGQKEKIAALEEATSEGWRVVSETIAPGKFKGKDACCLFLIFAPCALMAGHEDDVITVTLEKNDVPSQTEMSRSFSDRLIPENNFDRAKWNALLQYDKDIEAAAEKIRPLGPKWMDEFGFSYLSLNDKNYLTTIIEKIAERARLEQQENEKLRVEEEKKSKEDAEKLARAEEEAIKKSQAEDKKENRQKLIGFGILLIVLLMIVALIASYKN